MMLSDNRNFIPKFRHQRGILAEHLDQGHPGVRQPGPPAEAELRQRGDGPPGDRVLLPLRDPDSHLRRPQLQVQLQLQAQGRHDQGLHSGQAPVQPDLHLLQRYGT